MIGIIPTAGTATRMGGIPKFMLPLPNGSTLMQTLVQRMQRVELQGVVIGTNTIMRPLIETWYPYEETINTKVYVHDYGMTATMSETVRRAGDYAYTPFSKPALFGMPDTWFDDADAFLRLSAVLQQPRTDVAVGVWRARPGQHREGGMCRADGVFITEVVDKPEHTDLEWLWGVLAWQPSFWQHIDAADPHVGYAIPRAIEAGLKVRAVLMQGGFFDCGAPERYFALINHLTAEWMPA